MKSLWIGAAATALALTTTLPAMAGTLTYSGGLTATPTFDSPDTGDTTIAPLTTTGLGSIFPYSSQAFFVDTNGSYSFKSQPNLPVNWTPFTVLYQNAFNPVTSLTNALIAQPPSPTDNGTPVSFNFNLLANTPYFWVTTVFNPDDGFGTFTNTITGNGNITTPSTDIPTPALLPAILGLGAKFARDRRRQQRRQLQPQAV